MSLPVNLKIGGRLCVIIGGGHVARRKCLKLLEYGARVRVVASHFNEWDSIPKEAALDLIQRPFEEGDLAGAFLVIAATDDPDLNDRIA
ncbi:MAG: NAD(P)-dependent oxidoreductase, partial [Armatimonadetes bacterium]|nr:NAD(P)-dependent oxidoreductase [Armatimonadota bacterium]